MERGIQGELKKSKGREFFYIEINASLFMMPDKQRKTEAIKCSVPELNMPPKRIGGKRDPKCAHV